MSENSTKTKTTLRVYKLLVTLLSLEVKKKKNVTFVIEQNLVALALFKVKLI